MTKWRLRVLSVAAVLAAVGPAALAPQTHAAHRRDAADDQYAVASGHFRAKRWELAAEEYTQFLELWPNHRRAPAARFYLGEAEMERGRYDQARNVLRPLVADRAFPFHARVMFRVGQASWRVGDDKSARGELQAFLEAYPKDALRELALPYLADALLALGDFQQARTRYEQALHDFPKGRLADDCRYGLARALEQLGELPRAIELYRTLADNTTSDLADDAQLNLGARLFESKQYEAAAEVLEQLPRKFPASPLVSAAQLNEGWARYQLGQYAGAAALFGRLTEHDELGTEARYWHGLSYKALRRWQECIRILLPVAENEHHRLAADAEFHAADAMLQDGQVETAGKHFVHVAQRWPKADLADDSLLYAGQAEFQLEHYAQARALTEQLQRDYPESPLAVRGRILAARAHLAEGNYREAVAVLEPVVRAPDAEPTARFHLGVAYQQLELHQRALETLAPLRGGDVEDPMVVEATYRMGVSHAALDEDAQAVPLLQEYLRLDGDGPLADRALARLAVCYAELNQLDQAESRWRELVEAHANSAVTVPATHRIAEIAYETQQLQLAETLFGWIVARDGAADYHARALSGLGWCQYDREQFTEAARTMQRLIDEHPDDELAAEAALLRARALESAGSDAEALAAYALVAERFATSREAPAAALQRARLLYRTKDLENAAAAYERLFEQFPDLEQADQAAYERAWVYLDIGRSQRANELFLDLAMQFPESPFAPDALLNVAESHYRDKDYANASRLLDRLGTALASVDDADTRARLQEALWYRRGRIAADQHRWEDVGAPFQKLLTQSPASELALEAKFWLAEADYQLGDNPSAETALQSLLADSDVEQTPWVGTAWLRLAQVRARRKAWKEALDAAAVLKKRFPKYELTYEADYLMGRCLSSLPSPQFDEARQAFQRCIASPEGNKTETAAQAQLMIGETYFHQRDYARALREFLRIEPLYDYPVWQAAGLLEAGKCSEELAKAADAPSEARRQWQQAADLYQRILNHPEYAETDFADAAKERLAQVRGLAQSSP